MLSAERPGDYLALRHGILYTLRTAEPALGEERHENNPEEVQ
jgi:hypothetical protein